MVRPQPRAAERLPRRHPPGLRPAGRWHRCTYIYIYIYIYNTSSISCIIISSSIIMCIHIITSSGSITNAARNPVRAAHALRARARRPQEMGALVYRHYARTCLLSVYVLAYYKRVYLSIISESTCQLLVCVLVYRHVIISLSLYIYI